MICYPASVGRRCFFAVFVVLASSSNFSRAIADEVADSPEALISAYMEIPTVQWQKRLAYIAEPEKARPLMEKWYADNVLSQGTKVTAVSGATDPSLYRNVGDTLKVSFIGEDPDGSKVNDSFFVVRTGKGFKIDWLKSLKPNLLAKGWWEQGRLAEDRVTPEIKSKHLATVGERYVGKRVKLLSASFRQLEKTWLTQIPGVMVSSNGLVTQYDKKAAEAWVGFFIRDRDQQLCQFVFAPKDRWADTLLEMKEGQLMNLAGVVTELETMEQHGLLIYDIEVLDP